MKEKFKTHDLWFATLLKVKGFNLLTIQTDGNNRALFVFEDKPEREEILLDFLNGKTSVEPLTYVNAMKSLKALTYK